MSILRLGLDRLRLKPTLLSKRVKRFSGELYYLVTVLERRSAFIRSRIVMTMLVGLFGALLCAFSHPALAADDAAFAKAISDLNQDDFDAKTAAVQAIAASGNPRAVVVLKALSEGQLFAHTGDDKIVIAVEEGDANAMTDAVTGAAAGRASSDDLNAIVVNNEIRGAIDGLIGGLQLYSPVKAERLSAAKQLLDQPNAAAVPILKGALAKETDSSIHSVLTLALAASVLQGGGSDDDKIAALTTLSGTADTSLRSLVSGAVSDPSPAVQKAAKAALSGIDRRMSFVAGAQNIVFGLSLSSILLLTGIGLAITFGVMGVINMAHGEMMMLGAYAAFVIQGLFHRWLPENVFGLYLVVAVPGAFLVSGAVGVVIERTVIRFLYGRSLETLLATWGVSLILQQLVRSLFGPDNRAVSNPEWMSGSLSLFDVNLTTNRVVIILFGFATLLGLAAFLRWSRMGLEMRAVTQNRKMAAAMGIRTGWVDAMTFGLGSGIAGVAGVALSQVSNVSPNLGQLYIVDSFMVVVFGGVGSLWGTFFGAESLGLVNKLLEPVVGAVLGKILVLVFIILFIQKRPRGLFALRGRSVE